MAHHLPAVALVIVLLLFPWSRAAPPLPCAPYLASPRGWHGLPRNFQAYFTHGYDRGKGGPFSVPTDLGALLILPHKFIEEIRSLPEDIASFRKAFQFWFLHRHTNIGGDDIHQQALKVAASRHLTHHRDLVRIFRSVEEELQIALEIELPQSHDWSEVKAYPAIVRIVNRLVTRTFAGPELSQNQEYLDLNLGFAVNCLTVSRILAWCPEPLRPLCKFIVPGYLSLRWQEKRVQQILQPVIERRLEASDAEKPDDLLQWFIDEAPHGLRRDCEYLAKAQINASLAAIHSTAILAAHAVFELATRPQYKDSLRGEIASVEKDRMSILRLSKLDSFLKECQRMHPLGLIGLMRTTTSDLNLSNGTHIPANTQLAFAMHDMHRDQGLWTEANNFDGFRFSRLRETGEADSASWFTTTSARSYGFGLGIHACPGRFFAAMELKLLLADLLSKYDFMTEDTSNDYVHMSQGLMFLPDPKKVLKFRKR